MGILRIISLFGWILGIFQLGYGVELVSVNSDGEEANAVCQYPAISGNGRLVSFSSTATNLVPDDTNGVRDLFVRDLGKGTTKRISVDSEGNETEGSGGGSDFSANSRFVVFSSSAADLVNDDTNGVNDVFRHDLVTGETIRVSLDKNGNEIPEGGYAGKVNSDGTKVAFASGSPDLVPGDTNGVVDVFVKDLGTGAITRVTVDENGDEFTVGVGVFDFSDYGNAVAFVKRVGSYDRIFVWSEGSANSRLLPALSSESMTSPSISGSGRYVAYRSYQPPHDYAYRMDTVSFAKTLVTYVVIGFRASGNVSGVGISSSGQDVAFGSDAQSISSFDIHRNPDVYVRNVTTGLIDLVSHLGDDTKVAGDARSPVISANGAYTAFLSNGNFGRSLSGPTPRIFVEESHPKRRLRLTVSNRKNRRGKKRFALDLTDGRTHSFYLRVENNSRRLEKPTLIGTPIRKPLFQFKAISYSPNSRRNVTAGIIKGSKVMGYIEPYERFSIRVFVKRRTGRSGRQRVVYRLVSQEKKVRTRRVKIDLKAQN